MKKGFTLVELVITTVIMGMLIGLLFEIFVLIARIAVKVEHERSVHNEIIYVMQTIQNLIDQGNIEFADYVWWWDYDTQYGIYESLNLEDNTTVSGSTFVYEISRSCVTTWSLDDYICLWTNALSSTWRVSLNLTDSERVIVTNFYIKVLQSSDSETEYTDIVNDGFWLFLDVQIPEYDDTRRWFRVDQKVQTFFNLRKY